MSKVKLITVKTTEELAEALGISSLDENQKESADFQNTDSALAKKAKVAKGIDEKGLHEEC